MVSVLDNSVTVDVTQKGATTLRSLPVISAAVITDVVRSAALQVL